MLFGGFIADDKRFEKTPTRLLRLRTRRDVCLSSIYFITLMDRHLSRKKEFQDYVYMPGNLPPSSNLTQIFENEST